MKPAPDPHAAPLRPEHQTRKARADRAGEKSGEGADSVQQRRLRDRKARTGPSRSPRAR